MIQLIRGFKDVLPGEIEGWQWIENTARSLFEGFGFREIRIPIMERTELFARSIGEDTDIVEKEMYTFADRKGDLLTLRPEATASIVRAYIQHRLFATDPVQKFYMIGPMFRRERPQKGRYRQFYQIDAEIFGVMSPMADVELIFMLMTLLQRLGVSDILAHINTLGCPQCRPFYRQALADYLAAVDDQLCVDCKRRRSRNPLRVLDCKVPACRGALSDAPSILDHLCEECRQDFDTVQALLKKLRVAFEVDKRLVRGLDYYTRTTFEIQTGKAGAQSAVAGGGRYDNLVSLLGGPALPATGFAIGLDRLAEIAAPPRSELPAKPALFIAALGEQCQRLAFEWLCQLALRGVHAEMDYENRSLKSQMKRADKLGVNYTVLLGDDELSQGAVILRNMSTKTQETVPLEAFIDAIAGRLSG